jgi:hypothetical protein
MEDVLEVKGLSGADAIVNRLGSTAHLGYEVSLKDTRNMKREDTSMVKEGLVSLMQMLPVCWEH